MIKIIADKIKNMSELIKIKRHLNESKINYIMYPSITEAWCAEQVEKFNVKNKYTEGYSRSEQLALRHKMVMALHDKPEAYINSEAISIILKDVKDKFDRK